MALISVTPLARKGRVRATLVFFVHIFCEAFSATLENCVFILTWQELVPGVDLFKYGENFNPAFIFGNDYRYLFAMY